MNLYLAYFLAVLLSSFYLGFNNDGFNIKKTAKGYAQRAGIMAIFYLLVLYFFFPSFMGDPQILGLLRVIILPLLIQLGITIALAFEWNKKETIAPIIIGIILILVVFWAGIAGVTHPTYLNELPDVEVVSNFSEMDFTNPIDNTHIVQVDQQMAWVTGNKIIGDSSMNLGSQYKIVKEELTIQKVNGKIYWIAPLEYNGIFKWMAKKSSPGFIMVNAEDPNAMPELKLGYDLKYLPSAYLGSNLHRHIYFAGYHDAIIEDYSFEITDTLVPRWVVTITEPTLYYTGDEVKKVLIVNLETGTTKPYAPENAPDWIERIMPQRIDIQYMEWYGTFVHNKHPIFNWQELDMNEPTRTNGGTEAWFVFGNDNKTYWFSGMTSTSATDESLTSIMLMNTRTGKMFKYRTSGGNEQAAMDAVNSDIANYNGEWVSASIVVPYDIYGTLTYGVPIKSKNGYFKEFAFVDSTNQQVIRGSTMEEALVEYEKYLSKKSQGAIVPTSRFSSIEINGTVKRISNVIQDGESQFDILLTGTDIIFSGNPIFPELSVTQSGDRVRLIYSETGKSRVLITSFDNLDITVRVSEEQQSFNKEVEQQKEHVESNWDPQSEALDTLERLRNEDEV